LGKTFKEDESIYLELFISFALFLPQASQAAQEAEINARKAKNTVNSLLNLINGLLEQLG
jgi:hypothetical protein